MSSSDPTTTGLRTANGPIVYAYGYQANLIEGRPARCMLCFSDGISVSTSLTPAEARQLAGKLIVAADYAEATGGQS